MQKYLMEKWYIIGSSLFSAFAFSAFAILEPYHFPMQSPARYACLLGGCVAWGAAVWKMRQTPEHFSPISALFLRGLSLLVCAGLIWAAAAPDCYARDSTPDCVTNESIPFCQVMTTAPEGDVYLAKQGLLIHEQADSGVQKEIFEFDDPIVGIHCMKNGTILIGTDRDRWTAETPCRLYKLSPNSDTSECIYTVHGGCVQHWSMASMDDIIYICQYGPRTDGHSKQALRSRDMGRTWEVIFQGDPANNNLHMHRIAVDSYTKEVWLTMGDGPENRHALRSSDQGETWEDVLPCQATSIAFTPDAIYFGDDLHTGTIKRLCRKTKKADIVWMAKEHGVFGGSAYDITVGSTGLVYVPFRKYSHQNFAASIWVGRGEDWRLFFVCESHENEEIGWMNITAPDRQKRIRIGGHKFAELTEEQFQQLPKMKKQPPTLLGRALIGLGVGVHY